MHMGACITRRGQRSNTENEHCRYTHSRSDGKGGGYPPSVNSAPLILPSLAILPIHRKWKNFGCHGDPAVSGQPAFTSCCYCGFTSSLGSEGSRKKQQLDSEARRKLLLFPSFFYQQSLFLLFTVKCISYEVQTQLAHIELQENACKTPGFSWIIA